ncbi:MAG: hypothetical protein K1X64_06040 [Myxococcaceae bacterium]|nr:hypothetical protein [Myxococcaceae bacterium]
MNKPRHILSAALCSVLVAQAAPIKAEDFELTHAGDVSGKSGIGDLNDLGQELEARGWYVSANCTDYCSMTIVDAPFGRSGKVLRYEYRSDQDNEPVPQQDAHNANLIWSFSPPRSELWARYYFATDVATAESNATLSQYFNSGTKLHYIKPVGAGPSYVTGQPYTTPHGAFSIYATQEMAVCPSGGTPTFKGGGGCSNNLSNGAVLIDDKRWYCVEYHFKLNSDYAQSDGALEVWVDGTPVQSLMNLKMVDGHFTLADARIGSIEVYRQHSNHMLRYEDDLVWSDTRVGCLSGDTLSPGQPMNLLVQ